MNIEQHKPPHPGAFIKQVYIEPHALVPRQVALALKVNPSTFNRLLNEKSDITPEMALKLSKVLGRTPSSWLAMQDNFNLWRAAKHVDPNELESIVFS